MNVLLPFTLLASSGPLFGLGILGFLVAGFLVAVQTTLAVLIFLWLAFLAVACYVLSELAGYIYNTLREFVTRPFRRCWTAATTRWAGARQMWADAWETLAGLNAQLTALIHDVYPPYPHLGAMPGL
jgi:hypothetical protein